MIWTRKEYTEFEQSFADFMASEGLLSLHTEPQWEGALYDEHSRNPCECCGGRLHGERFHATGLRNKRNGQAGVVSTGPYAICTDCMYYAEYGELDDMTMMDMED